MCSIGENSNQIRGQAVYVDLIRAVAIVAIILLHASGSWLITSQEMSQMNPSQFISWSIVDVYQSFARLGAPLFIMLTGLLLLQPSKNESLSVFFKKRWARIGLPTLFWGAIYFVWDFLVIHTPFNLAVIAQGILNGPYSQFWYIYVLIGLYLLTPILRVFMAHADKVTVKYFVLLWLLGVSIIPVFGLFTPYTLSTDVFTITGFVGYFVLGSYLLSVQKPRRRVISIFMVLGIVLTALTTYVLAANVGGQEMYFFQQYFSPTVILATVMFFLLLLTVKPPSTEKAKTSKLNKFISALSQNTLAIFFIHVMLLESLENGYFGFALNRNTLNPIVEAPLMTVIVLFLSLGIVLLLKKIPYLKKVIG